MLSRLVMTFAALAFAASASAQAELTPTTDMPSPQQVTPHAITTPAPTDPVLLEKLLLLRERIAERDQLQHEIDQLIVETQTPQSMTVHFELLEVNHSAATKLGIMPTGRRLTGSFSNRLAWTLDDLEKLRQEGAVQTLFAPRVQVSSGEQTKAQMGAAPVNGEAAEIDSPYTKLEVRADSLGNNQVQVDFRLDRTTPIEGKKADYSSVPRTQCTTIDSRLAAKFGETESFGGLLSERTRTRRGALGRVTETIMVETVLLVRVDAEMPRTAGVVAASATAPR